MMGFVASEHLLSAAEEYSWLLSRAYPQKSSLKMVGDKFKLTRDMRQILYRGVSARPQAERRRKMIGQVQQGDQVLIDGYNVLFTINNYLLGRPLFISNDGLLRDAGEMRGRIQDKPVFNRAVEMMLETLSGWTGSSCRIYLDEPVSFSGRLSIVLSKEMAQMGIEGDACTVASPDHVLKHERSDVVCTSDTAILDQYEGRVTDLPRTVLVRNFKPDFLVLDV
jgi:hypothetical protein